MSIWISQDILVQVYLHCQKQSCIASNIITPWTNFQIVNFSNHPEDHDNFGVKNKTVPRKLKKSSQHDYPWVCWAERKNVFNNLRKQAQLWLRQSSERFLFKFSFVWGSHLNSYKLSFARIIFFLLESDKSSSRPTEILLW